MMTGGIPAPCHVKRKGPLQPDGFSAAAAIRACEHAGQWPLALALLQGRWRRIPRGETR